MEKKEEEVRTTVEKTFKKTFEYPFACWMDILIVKIKIVIGMKFLNNKIIVKEYDIVSACI